MAPLQIAIEAALALSALGAIAVLALRVGADKSPSSPTRLIDAIDNLLPQTQCGQCGHPGCRPYAEAIAQGEPFNRCPPGREHTIRALAELLNQPVLPLDGELKPKAVAFIREAECIGCTKCIQACPVDAILGASKLMHTVIADECTGCDLCVEPCPVDCIEMRPLPADQHIIAPAQAAHYRSRFNAHTLRLQNDAAEREAQRQARKAAIKAHAPAEKISIAVSAGIAADTEPASVTAYANSNETAPAPAAATANTNGARSKQVEIQAAIARARAKKAAAKNPGPTQ